MITILTLRALIFCLLNLLPSVSTLFADEAYQLDFHLALLGFPQRHTTFFHQPSKDSRASLIYTLSELGIVGAINPKDGGVIWRQQIGAGGNYSGQGFLKSASRSAVLASALDGHLQAWAAPDGRQLWSTEMNGKVKAVEIGVNEGATRILVASQEDGARVIIQSFQAETGELQWQFQDPNDDTPHSILVEGDRLFYISLHPTLLKGHRIKAVELNAADGRVRSQPYFVNSDSEVTGPESIVLAKIVGRIPIIMWTDRSYKAIKVASLFPRETTVIESGPMDAVTVKNLSVHTISHNEATHDFLIHYQGVDTQWASVFNLDPNTGRARKAYDLLNLPGEGVFSATSQGDEGFFVYHTSSEVALASSKAADFLQSWKIRNDSHFPTTDCGNILHTVSEVATRGTSMFSVRSVLVLECGSWEMIRNGEPLWMNKGSLNGVKTAIYVDNNQERPLIAAAKARGHQGLFHAYAQRLKTHLSSLRHLPTWIQRHLMLVKCMVFGDKGCSHSIQVVHDKFGFNKLLIVATRDGRVAAIASQDGQVVWDKQAAVIERGASWNVQSITVDADSALVHTADGDIVRMNIINGTISNDPNRPPHKVRAFDHFVNSREIQSTISSGKRGQSGVASGGDAYRDVLVKPNEGDVSLSGWVTLPDDESMLAWQFFLHENFKIADVLHRPTHDPIAAIGKALGDRNVLYKYINPNIVLITGVNTEASSVSFYLLDSTSGDLLHSITHADVDLSQPIASTVSENLFIYSLYSRSLTKETAKSESQKIHAYQLVVSEFFESSLPNDRGALSNAANFSTWSPSMSNAAEDSQFLHVASQSFLIPEPISFMSFTATTQGITPRSLLCITPRSKSVIMIPRQILEPRRPIGRDPTNFEMEEGLFRYNAILEFDPKWYLNHRRESLSFEGIITSPSSLESTSLIFTFGAVDLFGIRVSPIGEFDILGKGFNKLQLLATIVVLALGTGVLGPLVRKRQIETTWRI